VHELHGSRREGFPWAGALLGTRSSFDVANLLAKSLVCVIALGLVVPISLDRDERRALAARLGAAFRRG